MAKETILLKNYSSVFLELAADGTITPGDLLELTSTNAVQRHATAAGKHAWLFAVEDALQGRGINDNYIATDKVKVWVAGRGDVVNARLMDEENVVIGDYVESAGGGITSTGKVKKWTNGVIVGIVVEAKDLSTFPEGSESSAGGVYFNPRVKVQLI